MRAVVFDEPGRIAVRDYELPGAQPGDALVRVLAAGLCATDRKIAAAGPAANYPVLPGHEICGEIVEPGAASGLAAGDVVAVYPVVGCGACPRCQADRALMCERGKMLGMSLPGAMAEHLRVPAALARRGGLVPAAPGLRSEFAALAEPVGCVIDGLENAGWASGCRLLVFGAGPIGLLHVLVARRLGAAEVMVSEPLAGRRRLAESLGARAYTPEQIDAAAPAPAAPFPVDVAVLTIGEPSLIDPALRLVRDGGVVTLFGGFRDDRTLVDVQRLHHTGIHLTGSVGTSLATFKRALGLLPDLAAELERYVEAITLEQAVSIFTGELDSAGRKPVVSFAGG